MRDKTRIGRSATLCFSKASELAPSASRGASVSDQVIRHLILKSDADADNRRNRVEYRGQPKADSSTERLMLSESLSPEEVSKSGSPELLTSES